MHFEFDIATYTVQFTILLLGCLFWIGMIGLVAAFIVISRMMDELFEQHKKENSVWTDDDA